MLLALVSPAFTSRVLAGAGDPASRPGPIGRGADEDARVLVGKPPPALPPLRWLDGQRRTLDSLRGRVVLIRNFTRGCPFCTATMPALERLHRELASEGLTVLGVFHPKPARQVQDAEVAAFGRSLGVTFPLAVDPDWSLVKRWWLEQGRNTWTSVSWVIDRGGIVRLVHPGGEYHAGGGPDHARCREDHDELRTVVRHHLRAR